MTFQEPVRQNFLSASIIRGIFSCVFIPNPTVSARVKRRVFLPTTRLFSLNDTCIPGTSLSSIRSVKVYPSRALESVGIVIQRSVRGFSPGLVMVLILQSRLHADPGAPFVLSPRSHCSGRVRTPSPHLPQFGGPPHEIGVPARHCIRPSPFGHKL